MKREIRNSQYDYPSRARGIMEIQPQNLLRTADTESVRRVQPQNLLRTADTESVRSVPALKRPQLRAFYFWNCSRLTKMDRPRWLAVSMEYDTVVDACGTGCRPRHNSARLISCFTVAQGEINTLQSKDSGSRTRCNPEVRDIPGCTFRE